MVKRCAACDAPLKAHCPKNVCGWAVCKPCWTVIRVRDGKTLAMPKRDAA